MKITFMNNNYRMGFIDCVMYNCKRKMYLRTLVEILGRTCLLIHKYLSTNII